MTKVAILHNGTQIHFPDDMQDPEMDAAVQRHLGIGEPKPDMMATLLQAITGHTAAMAAAAKKEPKADVMQQLLQAISAHVGALATAKEGVDNGAKEISATAQQSARAHLGAMQDHTAVVGKLGEVAGQGFAGVMQPLAVLAHNSGQIPDLVNAVNQLSLTIIEVGKAVITALNAPKEIYHDAAGKAKGVRKV